MEKLSRRDFLRAAGVVTGTALLATCAPAVFEALTPKKYVATIEDGGSEDFSTAVQDYINTNDQGAVMVGAFKTNIDNASGKEVVSTQFGVTNSKSGELNVVVEDGGVRSLEIDAITMPGITRIVDPQSTFTVIAYPSDAKERIAKNEQVAIAVFPLASQFTKLEGYDGSPIRIENANSALKVLASLKNSIIYDYGQAVNQDIKGIQDAFSDSAVRDYSGQNLPACQVDSDCLAGEQVCLPGTVPNTDSMPGYCVQNK